MKTLYMMHIPKTGGLTLQALERPLESNNLLGYPTSKPFTSFNDYAFIRGHFGTLPKLLRDDLDVAVLIRDPLERLISNFIWLTMKKVLVTEAYSSLGSIKERLEYYLFSDQRYASHHNLQARFLCNPIDEYCFNFIYSPSYELEKRQEQFAKIGGADTRFEKQVEDWFIPNDLTSIDKAKAFLDSATIVGTTDNHEVFMASIFNWFKEHYSVDLEQEYLNQIPVILQYSQLPRINYSQFTDTDGIIYTTQSLKALLTQEEIDRIYADNSMDVELYEYAKAKLQ